MFRHHDITLLQAVEIARAAELSEQSTADLERLQLSSQTPGHVPFAPPASQVHDIDYDDFTPSEDLEPDNVGQVRAQPRRKQPASSAATPLTPQNSKVSCLSCGGRHDRQTCQFRNAICRRCQRQGHIAQVCRASLPAPAFFQANERTKSQQRRQQPPKPTRRGDDCHNVSEPQEVESFINQASSGSRKVTANVHLAARVLQGNPHLP
ncbi:uncharacterized protein LOC116505637 [Thamnophis elegans]|uniref:uncharacterized protein LOC116505637 n=1 Tax=Thamnophis elegans TaxID=35005 RepID=UPI00137665A5|nr:uncharacterized protein LOC116505637 [Thamnophis elegans]